MRKLGRSVFFTFLLVLSCITQDVHGQTVVIGAATEIVDYKVVSRPSNSTDVPDGFYSILTNGSYITLDLGARITEGDLINFKIGRFFFPGKGHVEISLDGIDFKSAFDLDEVIANISSPLQMVDAEFIVNDNSFRFVRVHSMNSVLLLDAVTYESRSGDVDGDGVLNDVDCKLMDPLLGLDTDIDGVCNETDADADNDGIMNVLEMRQDAVLESPANSLFSQNSIGGSGGDAARVSDNIRAVINRTSDYIILDMGGIIPAGVDFIVEAQVRRNFHTLGVEGSSNVSSFSELQNINWSSKNVDQETALAFHRMFVT